MADLNEPMKFKDREARIREKAYDLWEREGRPEGQALDHWHRAAQDVDRAQGAGATLSAEEPAKPSGDAAAPVGGAQLEDAAPPAKPRTLRQR